MYFTGLILDAAHAEPVLSEIAAHGDTATDVVQGHVERVSSTVQRGTPDLRVVIEIVEAPTVGTVTR